VSYNPKSYPIYPDILSPSLTAKGGRKLLNLVEKTAPGLGIDYSTLDIEYDLIYEIADMVHRRKVYFHVFHGGMDLGELNEGCLLAFWILKFCPFRDKTKKEDFINERIALAVLIVSIHEYIEEEKKLYKTNRKVVSINKKRSEYLLHAFKFRDLSKEAIMAIGESLIDGNPPTTQVFV
jgi:hypothetical protein